MQMNDADGIRARELSSGVRGVLASARPGHGNVAALVKRLVDVILAGIGLGLSWPLWLAIALAVKCEDGGPVFYDQDRVGLGGKLFRSRKFRSMIVDADAEFGPLQAREADPRVTRVGRFLRATALDELPQLWSIFFGDMSFVGPRPLIPEEVEVTGPGNRVRIDEIPGYSARHTVRPGLTGLAQVYAPRDIPRRYKFQYDLIYIRNQNLRLDLKLIILSFWVTLRGKWESRSRKL